MLLFLFIGLFAFAEFEPDPLMGCRTLLTRAQPGTLKAASILQFLNNTKRIFSAIEDREIIFEIRGPKSSPQGYLMSLERFNELIKTYGGDFKFESVTFNQFKNYLLNPEWLAKSSTTVLKTHISGYFVFVKPSLFDISAVVQVGPIVDIASIRENFDQFYLDVGHIKNAMTVTKDDRPMFAIVKLTSREGKSKGAWSKSDFKSKILSTTLQHPLPVRFKLKNLGTYRILLL